MVCTRYGGHSSLSGIQQKQTKVWWWASIMSKVVVQHFEECNTVQCGRTSAGSRNNYLAFTAASGNVSWPCWPQRVLIQCPSLELAIDSDPMAAQVPDQEIVVGTDCLRQFCHAPGNVKKTWQMRVDLDPGLGTSTHISKSSTSLLVATLVQLLLGNKHLHCGWDPEQVRRWRIGVAPLTWNQDPRIYPLSIN